MSVRRSAVSGQRLSVLLVDDEPAHLELWKALLLRAGYDVFCAESGMEALLLLAQGVDCVVTDYERPQMSGLDLIRRCANPGGPRFIMLTGSVATEVCHQALAAGACRVLARPTSIDNLVSAIEQACWHVPHVAPAGATWTVRA